MATIKKRTGNRLFTAIIAVVMLCTLVATTAFAKKTSVTLRGYKVQVRKRLNLVRCIPDQISIPAVLAITL